MFLCCRMIPINACPFRLLHASKARLIFESTNDKIDLRSSAAERAWLLRRVRTRLRDIGVVSTSATDMQFMKFLKCTLSAWRKGMLPKIKNLRTLSCTVFKVSDPLDRCGLKNVVMVADCC